jgi:peptidoglycan/xylan/chitin deacetylase (PgdA/CDA1 family)/glycosyltransferase involved in cell wall biosynthesis
MKIWHIGASSNPNRVDGVSRTVWLLSREQSRLGHEITLVLDTAPEPEAVRVARENNVQLLEVSATFLNYASEIRHLLETHRPELVHMHSVFIPRQAAMARVLRSMGIPYVITPHGGLAPQVLRRGVIKKSAYAMLRERPRFMGAAAIGTVTPAEGRAVKMFIPDYRGPVRWLPNPVDADQLAGRRWAGVGATPSLAFLGRFDVVVKGIDILIAIARSVPEMAFHLYGTEDPKTLPQLNELRRNLPGNLQFHAPVFGAEKVSMLSKSSLYLQPSRWEGFPISVAECMYLGVPTAVTDTLDIAQLFFQENLGLVIPMDPQRAAAQLRAAFVEPARLDAWSQRAKAFASEFFEPEAAAQRHIEFYKDILSHHAGSGARICVRQETEPERKPLRLMPVHLRATVKNGLSQIIHRSRKSAGMEDLPRTVGLCYHSINSAGADLAVEPGMFRSQLLMLKDRGYRFLNFGELVQRLLRWGPPRERIACITFDDGYADNLTQAAPILDRLGISATVFVTSGLMIRDAAILDRFRKLTGYPTDYLSPAQVQQLARRGIEIGAHTHSHPNLARLGVDQMREEIVRSKSLISDAAETDVRTFAFPFGKRNIHYTDDTVQVVRESGFIGSAAVAFRAVNPSDAVRVFELPRFFVNRSDSMQSFEQKLSGAYDWLGTIQQATPGWLKGIVSPEDRYAA